MSDLPKWWYTAQIRYTSDGKETAIRGYVRARTEAGACALIAEQYADSRVLELVSYQLVTDENQATIINLPSAAPREPLIAPQVVGMTEVDDLDPPCCTYNGDDDNVTFH